MIRKDIKEKVNVIFSKTMKHSIKKGWQSEGSQILAENIRRGKTIAFHPGVDDAMQIEYHYMGTRQTAYVHWRDLKVVNETPKSPPKPVLFDVKNLDI